MFTVTEIKSHLAGMGHGKTLNKVTNVFELFERAAAIFLLKVHPIESQRTAPLASTIHDDVYNYGAPSDFGSLIDLIPQDNRGAWDKALRDKAGNFDRTKAFRDKIITIEGSEGTKIFRISWRSRQGKVLNSMNSVDGNGTWSAVGSATGVATDNIFKVSGSGSVKFTHVVTGDGIQCTDMTALDLTTENRVADVFVWVYLSVVPTSLTPVWGNDLTTNYWTGVAQTTQADGTAFKIGWNQIKASWSGATQTGTVNPATIDSFKVTAVGTALGTMRIDNIVFSIGRSFDCKYYSKYLYKNSSGTWLSKPTTDDDSVVLDNDTLPLFLKECLIEMAQQMEGTDAAFDIEHALTRLRELYPAYKGLYPSEVKKVSSGYGSKRPGRNRW